MTLTELVYCVMHSQISFSTAILA